jgi:hypothetical protein
MIVTRTKLFFLEPTLYVRLTVSESNNGQSLSFPVHPKPKRHNAKLCSFAIRERIVNALANGDSKRAIARALRVSNNTVTAIAEQEWQRVEARKALLAARYERIADLATEKQINQLESNEKIPLNVLQSVGGIAVDKFLALRGEPSLTIHHEHTHTHQQELIIDLIKKFNLDPAVIIQNMQHCHTNSPMQNLGIAVLNAFNDKAEKRAKANVIDAEPVTALPPGDASVAGKNAGQKEG